MKPFIWLAIILSIPISSFAQNLVVLSLNGQLYQLDVQTCNLDSFVNTNPTLTDISYGPDGQLYGIRAGGEVLQIDTINGTTELIHEFDATGFNGLTISWEGLIYASNSFGEIHAYDPSSGIQDSLVSLNYPSGGDLTFLAGYLYYVGTGEEIIRIDLNDLENPVLEINESIAGTVLGLSSIITNCTDANIYALLSDISPIGSKLYQLDFSESDFNLICELDIPIDGSTYKQEYYGSIAELWPYQIASLQIDTAQCGQSDGTVSINLNNNFTESMYSLNDGPLQSNNTFTGLSEGEYSLIASNDIACSDTLMLDFPCNNLSSLELTQSKSVVSIYPNPTFSNIYISGLDQFEAFEIFHSSGLSMEAPYVFEHGNIAIDLSAFEAGLYYIKIKNLVHTILKK